jgi:hypothetical protein
MEVPSPAWDSLMRETRAIARRRRRRRRQWIRRIMLSLLTVVTAVVLTVIVVMVRDMAKTPTAAGPTALADTARTVSKASGPAQHGVSAQPASSESQPLVVDTSSGLSYRLLSSPWRRGCPSALDTPMFSWSAGERAVAGQVAIGGSTINWHGLACSGQLQQPFQYSRPADLEPTAQGLAGALDPAYYSGLRHYRTLEASYPTQVSGHPAWVVRFLMTYTDASAEGLAWTSEAGAVVVVDRGAGRVPAIFYVSVPSNLGTGNVSLFISSLRLS